MWQVIEVQINDDADPVEQFAYDPAYIDALVMRWYDSDTDGTLEGDMDAADDGEQYYLYDASYNVIALLDDQGTAIERYRYTPYGERGVLDPDFSDDADDASDYGQQRGFQGLLHDPESGLIENRIRMLDPLTGRFVQRDPLGYPDGMNAYAAYHVMWGGVDPSGEAAPAIVLLVVGLWALDQCSTGPHQQSPSSAIDLTLNVWTRPRAAYTRIDTFFENNDGAIYEAVWLGEGEADTASSCWGVKEKDAKYDLKVNRFFVGVRADLYTVYLRGSASSCSAISSYTGQGAFAVDALDVLKDNWMDKVDSLLFLDSFYDLYDKYAIEEVDRVFLNRSWIGNPSVVDVLANSLSGDLIPTGEERVVDSDLTYRNAHAESARRNWEEKERIGRDRHRRRNEGWENLRDKKQEIQDQLDGTEGG